MAQIFDIKRNKSEALINPGKTHREQATFFSRLRFTKTGGYF